MAILRVLLYVLDDGHRAHTAHRVGLFLLSSMLLIPIPIHIYSAFINYVSTRQLLLLAIVQDYIYSGRS